MHLLALPLLFAATPPPPAAVTGRVVLLKPLPAPRVFQLEPDMRAATGKTTFADPTYQVAADGGLANCVITLHPIDPAVKPAVNPAVGVTFVKDGPGYDPRVLVVPVGTRVTLLNRGSPCLGFMGLGRLHSFNVLVPKGKRHEVAFTARDVVPVKCSRPYMLGYVVVVDTPYHARTDAAGRFRIAGVPPGRYRVTTWHEAEGRLKGAGPTEVTVRAGEPVRLNYQVK